MSVVDRFGGSVGDPCVVPVDDVGVPAGQGASEAARFRRTGSVGEFGGVTLGELGTVDVIEAAEGFLGVPRQAHLAVGVAGCEQAAESGVAAFAEAFVGGDQQSPRSILGIILAAGGVERVVLSAPSHLVDAPVGQADDMERVGDLADLG